ncbi:DUF2059 domain-containing protein [Desulfovibrio sp. JC022]|uniref:DUF2059 domain-containing protein n=1 Tax=Desulfovibrio sp. JC022 TaxID=2593642 RepID=UPI0013D00CAF|nr:DUF2059 domain-containing protein [Desulfovibrio sp. JC022]NDV23798.1 DUF2059 domain-containing protein [Desulfovibrio sp. JC022]
MNIFKTSFICMLAIFCLAAQPVQADEKEKMEVALELIRESINMQAMYITFENMTMATIENDINNDLKTMGHRKPLIKAYKEAVKEAFYDPKVIDGQQSLYAKIYAKEFTKQELEELLHFYRTHLGKKFMKKQPHIAIAAYEKASELVGPVFVSVCNKKLAPKIEKLQKDGIMPTE